MRGILILIEGLDRSGKSTQCSLLKSSLPPNTTLYKFPDRSPTTSTGALLHNYLTDPSVQLPDQAVHLLFSANRWERQSDILGDLAAGKCVVMDRYVYSGISFTHAKKQPVNNNNNNNNGDDDDEQQSSTLGSLRWCAAPDIGLPRPDITIFLDIDEATASKRGGYGAERYETPEIQKRVRDVFRQFEKVANHDEVRQRWWTVDASGSVDQVRSQIMDIVNIYLADMELRQSKVDSFKCIV